jgi:hypothetical protein
MPVTSESVKESSSIKLCTYLQCIKKKLEKIDNQNYKLLFRLMKNWRILHMLGKTNGKWI